MQRFYGDDPHIINGGARKPRKSRRSAKNGGAGTGFAFFLVLASVIVLFATAFGAGERSGSVRVKRKEWYYVSVLTVSDSGQADAKALDIRTRGGAGYIYNDGNFSVVAAVYPTEKEARAVAAKQPDPSEVIKVSFPETVFPAEQVGQTTKSAFALPESAVAVITETANDYEKGNLTESEVAFRLDSISKEADKLSAALASSDGSASVFAVGLLGIVSQAVRGTDEDGSAILSSRLRFAACEIVGKVSASGEIYAGLRQLP